MSYTVEWLEWTVCVSQLRRGAPRSEIFDLSRGSFWVLGITLSTLSSLTGAGEGASASASPVEGRFRQWRQSGCRGKVGMPYGPCFPHRVAAYGDEPRQAQAGRERMWSHTLSSSLATTLCKTHAHVPPQLECCAPALPTQRIHSHSSNASILRCDPFYASIHSTMPTHPFYASDATHPCSLPCSLPSLQAGEARSAR